MLAKKVGEEEDAAKKEADSKAKEENEQGEGTEVTPSTAPSISQEELIDKFLENNSFEVVPVTMPTPQTKFVARSLYVDDCGQFKDLPVNCRASKVAKREIKGDAFLLSNHDDPALPDWERVDTTLECYEELYQNADKREVYDTSNTSQMNAITQWREDLSKKIEEEDVEVAIKAKGEGNELVGKCSWKEAAEAYGVCIERTSGRRDLLKDEAAATALHLAARLNRSLCFVKLRQFEAAAEDANWVVSIEPKNLKGMYRLAQAQIGLQEYEKAANTVKRFAEEGGSEEDKRTLQQAITDGAQALRERQKKMFGKMFSL